mgnify:CR=1 FL=1
MSGPLQEFCGWLRSSCPDSSKHINIILSLFLILWCRRLFCNRSRIFHTDEPLFEISGADWAHGNICRRALDLNGFGRICVICQWEPTGTPQNWLLWIFHRRLMLKKSWPSYYTQAYWNWLIISKLRLKPVSSYSIYFFEGATWTLLLCYKIEIY